jgi:hypothetical protein
MLEKEKKYGKMKGTQERGYAPAVPYLCCLEEESCVFR